MSFNTSRSSFSHDRKLRYRALLEDLASLDVDNPDNDEQIQKTATVVHEAAALMGQARVEERVKHPGEGYLDSRVLRATSDLAVRCSESVTGNTNVYDKHELAAHIREHPMFWQLVFPLEVPPACSLFGTFPPQPPEPRARAPRRRLERQQAAQLSAPENVDRLEKTEEGSEMVSRVNRFITKLYRNRGEPLSYFHIVLDPDSFARTIENIYYVSFLVRDGMCSVDIDEEVGLPFVRPVPQQPEQDGGEENQFIVSLDMTRWQELVQAFDIHRPMMVLKRL